MPVLATNAALDAEPTVFGDLASDPDVADAAVLLYQDLAQHVLRKNGSGSCLVLTALPSPRLLLFLTRNGALRSLRDIRSVAQPVPDAAHERLCACVLKACGIEPSDVEWKAGREADAMFVACNQHELQKLRFDPDICMVPYVPDQHVLSSMAPFLRSLTVHVRDWLPKCTRTMGLVTVSAVDTILCAEGTLTRLASTKVLRRFRGALDQTAFVAAMLGDDRMHAVTTRLLHAARSSPPVVPPPSPVRKGPSVLLLQPQSFAEVYLATRDGSGTVHTMTAPPSSSSFLVPGHDVLLRAHGRDVPKPTTLRARVAALSAGGRLRLSVPPQPDVAWDARGQYRCMSPDLTVPVGRLTQAACEREGVYTWDRPCEADEDCPFAGSSCSSGGYCSMPAGVTRMGYRRFRLGQGSYPVCGADACDPVLLRLDLPAYMRCCARRLWRVGFYK